MKKRFSILGNVAMLVLCVCAIAVGVYSAKQATANVAGTVGFTAHDCIVDVTVRIWGDAVNASNEPDTHGTPRLEGKAKTYTEHIEGEDKSIDFETIYFSDLTEDLTIAPITIKMSFENKSDFYVSVKATAVAPEGVTVTNSGKIGMDERTSTKNKTGDITITYTKTDENALNEAPITISVNLKKAPKPLPFTFSGEELTGCTIPYSEIGDTDIVIPSSYSLDEDGQAIVGNDYRVTTIGPYGLYYGQYWKSVTIPESITSIRTYFDRGSWGRVNITSLDAWVNIDFADLWCNPLVMGKSLYLNGVEVTEYSFPEGTTRIKPYVFCGCKSLRRVTIPSTVTSIGTYAFQNTNIQDFTIPASVKSIGECALYTRDLRSVSFEPEEDGSLATWTASKDGAEDVVVNVSPDGTSNVYLFAGEYCSYSLTKNELESA